MCSSDLGTAAADAPVRDAEGRAGWLLEHLGRGFVILSFGPAPQVQVDVPGVTAPVCVVGRDLHDAEGLLAARYDGQPGTVYLLRPDQHVAARWRRFDGARIAAAMNRCLGRSAE